MAAARGEAVGYDADLMAFKFTMRNGQQIVQCQISRAALGDLAGGWTAGAARDLPGLHFCETHSEQRAKVMTRVKTPIRKHSGG